MFIEPYLPYGVNSPQGLLGLGYAPPNGGLSADTIPTMTSPEMFGNPVNNGLTAADLAAEPQGYSQVVESPIDGRTAAHALKQHLNPGSETHRLSEMANGSTFPQGILDPRIAEAPISQALAPGNIGPQFPTGGTGTPLPITPPPRASLSNAPASNSGGQGSLAAAGGGTQAQFNPLSNLLMSLGIGLLSNSQKGFGPGLGQGFQLALQNQQNYPSQQAQLQHLQLQNQVARQQLQQAQQGLNSTRAFLESRGVDPVTQQFLLSNPKALHEYIKSQTGFGGDTEKGTYYGNPIRFTKPDGSEGIGTFNKNGDFKEIDTGGRRLDLGLKKYETDTEIILYNPSDGSIVNRQKKDVLEGAKQKAIGAAEGQIEAERPAAESRAVASISKAESVSSVARRLASHAGLNAATGPISSQLPTFSKQTANFETEIETLKNKVFVSALQEMRELSKTGGALGSITENEIKLLQNSIQNLDLSQGEENLRANLQQLAKDFDRSIARIKAAYKRQYGSDLTGFEEPAQEGPKVRVYNPDTGRLE